MLAPSICVSSTSNRNDSPLDKNKRSSRNEDGTHRMQELIPEVPPCNVVPLGPEEAASVRQGEITYCL